MAVPQRQEAQIVFNHINIKLSSHFTDREGTVHLVKNPANL